MIGIYKITNKINKKYYIGQSNQIGKRWRDHKTYQWKRHPEYPLYKAFIKYGIENFTFEVIEQCQLSQLDERERYWIKYYNSLVHNNGYNIREGGYGEPGELHPNHKLTEKDVIDIRTRYNNHERCKEVEKLYFDKIGHNGFSKIWKGQTWKHIMPQVYTEENKNFHLHNTGQKGSENGRSKLTEEIVYEIRVRKKNGEKIKDVYEDYKFLNITFGSFQNVWYGCNWKHVIVK